LFLNFEDDLDRIKEMYEENKEKPPITHNAPTVASALLWIRQLIQRIEEPMKIFRENKLLMSNRVRFLS
jgi:dynein heavy chain